MIHILSECEVQCAPRSWSVRGYACTFPEHYAGGTKGVMTVRL